MVKQQRNTAPYWNWTLKFLGVTFLLLVFLLPASFAQNTKGDKPQSSSGTKREAKKVKGKKSSKAGKAQSAKKTKLYSQRGPYVNKGSRTVKDQKKNLKSSSSKSSRVSGRSSSRQTRNVYPQSGPFVNNSSPVPQSKPPKVTGNKSRIKSSTKSKSISSTNVYNRFDRNANNVSRPRKEKPYIVKSQSPGYRRVKTPPKDSQQKNRVSTTPHYGVRSVSGQTKNVYRQKGPFVHNPSQKAQKQQQKTVSNKSYVARVSGGSHVAGPGKGKKRKGAISASRPYVSGKSINAFAGFWNKKPKGEKAYTSGDLAGHKLRKKNYQTKMPVIVNPTAHPYKAKKSLGDKPYSGPKKGGYKTATQPGKAWSGDIAGRKIRGRNLSSKKTVQPGQPVFPPKKTKQKIGDTPYRGNAPGGGAQSATGTFKKSTGPLPVKRPLSAGGAGYSGNIKSRKAAKGGGSVSGGGWNNEGQPLIGTAPLRRNVGYALFSGNKKTRPAPKGGGSVSGKMWNNQNRPLAGKTPSGTSVQMGSYRGNLKAQKPLKGGGSVSGGLWNNDNRPLVGKGPSGTALEMGAYQGNMKATKKSPDKSIGGVGKFRDMKPAMRNQGEEFTGFLKAHKPGKPSGQAAIENYQGNMRASRKEPSKEVGGTSPKKYRGNQPVMRDQGEEFTGFIKLPRFKKAYINNPKSAEASLKKARPNPSIKAIEYSKVMRMKYDYIHNPSSSKDALKTLESGKAFARESDYQGNVKMKKFDLFGKKDLHPDAQFVKTNKNNVDSERSLLTNFKLAWARLFGKNDLQPGSIREKEKKAKYHKDEGQIWYNQHNSAPGKSNSLKNVKTSDDN